MKGILGVIAVIIAAFGLVNFLISMKTSTPIPIAISHPLAMLAMFYLLFQHIFPSLLYTTTSQQYQAVIEQLRSTGSEIASGWTGGRIGLLYFRGPLIGVSVFPGGVLIKPMFLPAAPILREEITTIRECRQLFVSVIEIHHRSHRIGTPLIVEFSTQSNIGRALLQLKPTTNS